MTLDVQTLQQENNKNVGKEKQNLGTVPYKIVETDKPSYSGGFIAFYS